MTLPLSGIKVVDLTQVYSGPYATFLLAEAGADVIKVEPLEGEKLRRMIGAAATPHAMFNANKASVSLDLKSSEGARGMRTLLAGADVLVENFRPGVLAGLGFDDATLAAINPRLIRASLSGFGSDGPYCDYAALDIVVQALVGVIATTGFRDAPPVKAGAALADILGGTHLYGAVVTALLHRERTGEARPVETSMFAATYPAMASSLGPAAMAAADDILRTGNHHGAGRVCPYNVYPANDGHVAIICTTDRHWQRVASLLGLDELMVDPGLATMDGRIARMAEVDDAISAVTSTMARATLFDLLAGGGVPCGPVKRLQEVIEDPHLLVTGALLKIDHPLHGPLTVQRGAIRFPGLDRPPYRPSVSLGADNHLLAAAGAAETNEGPLHDAARG
jgi:formyl-CoA transferase